MVSEVATATLVKSRAGKLCSVCNAKRAALKRPKTFEQICKECFYVLFEDEIHRAIVDNNLFKRGERIAVGAFGGKETALDHGAALLKVDKLVTRHNADDMAETVLLNILRGDIARLSRCTSITTGEDGPIPRCKPFKYTYEKEIDIFVVYVLIPLTLLSLTYAYFKRLDYFSTECIYSPNAYRGFAREFIKDLERIRPRAILDIIKSGEDFRILTSTKMPEQGNCEKCGYISSQKWCIGQTRGFDNEPSKETKESIGRVGLQSKQCGTLDF
ncbi:cytosolic thiouridylase subunit Ctu1 [Orobanche gracilis]